MKRAVCEPMHKSKHMFTTVANTTANYATRQGKLNYPEFWPDLYPLFSTAFYAYMHKPIYYCASATRILAYTNISAVWFELLLIYSINSRNALQREEEIT